MRIEKIERIKNRLNHLSAGAPEMLEAHWLSNDETGQDADEDYCNSCARVIAEWYNGGEKPDHADAHMIPD